MRLLRVSLSANEIARSGRLASAGAAQARDTLVGTDWLAANLANPAVRVGMIIGWPPAKHDVRKPPTQ